MSPLSRAAVALALLALAACSQQGPAEKAVDAAESALAAVHEDAVKYVPDEYKAVKADLDRARELIKAGKYSEALDAIAKVPERASTLATHAAESKAKLAEKLQGDWKGLTDTVPGMVSSVEAKMAELAAAKKLPAGMDKAVLDDAAQGLARAKEAWATANEKFAAGDYEQAVANALGTQTLARKLMVVLGMAPAEDASVEAPAPGAAPAAAPAQAPN